MCKLNPSREHEKVLTCENNICQFYTLPIYTTLSLFFRLLEAGFYILTAMRIDIQERTVSSPGSVTNRHIRQASHSTSWALKLFICRTKGSTFFLRSHLGHGSGTLWESSAPPHRPNSHQTRWFHTLSALVSQGPRQRWCCMFLIPPPENLLPSSK